MTETRNTTHSLPPLPLPSLLPFSPPTPTHRPVDVCLFFDFPRTHTSTSAVHLMPQRSGPKLHSQFHSVGLCIDTCNLCHPITCCFACSQLRMASLGQFASLTSPPSSLPSLLTHIHPPRPPSPIQSPLVMQRIHSSSNLHLPTRCTSATPQAVASSMPACVSLSSAPVRPAVSVHCSHTTVSFAAKHCPLFSVGCCLPLSAHASKSQVER